MPKRRPPNEDTAEFGFVAATHNGVALPPGVPTEDRRIILPSTNRTNAYERIALNEVKKANALAEARYFLSARAQKFLMYAISLIDPADETLSRMYTVHARPFAEWAGLCEKAVRRDFWDPPINQREVSIAREFFREGLIIPDYFNEARGTRTSMMCNWFARIQPQYPSGPSDFLDVNFSQYLAPLLLNVRERYYYAKQVVICKLVSQFAIRLYEWIQQKAWTLNQNGNRFQLPLDDLRGILATDRPTDLGAAKGKTKGHVLINGTVYRRKLGHFGHFREAALDVAVKEVNEHTDFVVTYTAMRGGRSNIHGVHTVEFVVRRKTPEEISAGGSSTSKEKIVLPFQCEQPDLSMTGQPLTLPTSLPKAPESSSLTRANGRSEQRAAEPGNQLAGFTAELAEEYGLSTKQHEQLVSYARTHGCTSDTDCVVWLKERHKRNRDYPADKRAGFFWASVRDGHRYEKRGHVKKLPKTTKAAGDAKPVANTLPTDQATADLPADTAAAPESDAGVRTTPSDAREMLEKWKQETDPLYAHRKRRAVAVATTTTTT